jgi:acyl carrier protein
LSIAWGNWDAVGMTAALDAEGRRRLARRGIVPMAPAAALEALGQAPLGGPAAIVVAPFDWSALDVERRPFYAGVAARVGEAPASEAGPSTAPDLLQRWVETPIGRRPALLLAHIRAEAINVLGLPFDQQIAPRQPFKDLGLDSLMAIELRNALSRSLACPLPATLLFDRPTGVSLVEFLLAHVPALRDDGVAPVVPVDVGPVAGDDARRAAEAELTDLSDAEAEALLLAELDTARR